MGSLLEILLPKGIPQIFVLLMQEKFRKFSKFVLLMQAIFYEKLPKFSQKFLRFSTFVSKSKKCIIFAPKFGQIFPQKYKNSNFFLKNFYFFKIAQKCSKNP